MKKEYINKCIEITKEILTYTHKGDISPAITYMHNNCLWIGPLGNQFLQGKNEIIKAVMKQKKGMPKIYLESKEFNCVAQDRHGCLVAGKYIVVTDRNSHELFREMQRATFVWKVIKEELWIMHIHISSPKGSVSDNYSFPHQLSIYTKEYLNMLIRQEVERSGYIKVKDQSNVYHVIQISDIIYCEAFDSNTVIHTTKEDIVARIMLSKVEEKLKEKDVTMFIRVHKSFIVNKYYVNTIQRYELGLANEYRIPVSKQRYLDIQEKLHV